MEREARRRVGKKRKRKKWRGGPKIVD